MKHKPVLEIDFVIQTSLVAIYSNNLLGADLFLKGGQALRVKENLTNRFSADMDFSVRNKIENSEVYFEMLRDALAREFFTSGYYLFDFKYVRQPKFPAKDAPDFWSGWAVEFKLIDEKKRNLSAEDLSRSALVPKGTLSPKIQIDISQFEYCDGSEKVSIKSVEVQTYSRALLLVEKIRAICQQHPDYPYKDSNARARDYYDIEQLWSNVVNENQGEKILAECGQHLPKTFAAKGVQLDLLNSIFDSKFTDLQALAWPQVERTVAGRIQSFDYYVDTLRRIVRSIPI